MSNGLNVRFRDSLYSRSLLTTLCAISLAVLLVYWLFWFEAKQASYEFLSGKASTIVQAAQVSTTGRLTYLIGQEVNGFILFKKDGEVFAHVGKIPKVSLQAAKVLTKSKVEPVVSRGANYVLWSPRQLQQPYWLLMNINHTLMLKNQHSFLYKSILVTLLLILLILTLVVIVLRYVVYKPMLLLYQGLLFAYNSGAVPGDDVLPAARHDEVGEISRMVIKLLKILQVNDYTNQNADVAALEQENKKLHKQLERHKQHESELRSLSQLPEENVNPVLRISGEGIVLYANKASRLLLFYWQVSVGDKLPAEWSEMILTALQLGEHDNMELQVGNRHFLIAVTPVPEANYVNLYAVDISQRKRFERELRDATTLDAVTKLPVQYVLEDRIEQLIKLAQPANDRLVLLCLGVNDFADINAAYGHSNGDRILKFISQRLKKCLPESAILSRISDSKFAVALPDANDLKTISQTAELILQRLQAQFPIGDQEIHIDFSLGISLFPQDGATASELVTNAQLALFRARAQGRNRYQYYVEGMNKSLEVRRKLINALHQAVTKQQFILYLQPKYELVNNTLCGAEALIRWQHPQRGLLLPKEFIHLAEDSGVINEIGHWVIDETCRLLSTWVAQNKKIVPVAINVAALQFYQADILAQIGGAMKQYGITPNLLEIEITERTALQEPQKAVEIITELRKVGVQVSLDDFGTGYSSLNYLVKMPVDRLKIDLSFIQDLETSPDKELIVKMIIQLSQNLGVKCLAEGIETKEQLQLLGSFGCDEGQGFFLRRPMPVHDFVTEFLSS